MIFIAMVDSHLDRPILTSKIHIMTRWVAEEFTFSIVFISCANENDIEAFNKTLNEEIPHEKN